MDEKVRTKKKIDIDYEFVYHEYTESGSSMSKRRKKRNENFDELTSANVPKCDCLNETTSEKSPMDVKETYHLDNILRKKVPWDGYSPLHSIVNGKKPGVLARLIEMGYVPNKGKWMPEEIEQLNRNMDEFIRDHNVKDFKNLICNGTIEDKMFRKKSQFILKLSKGISRTGVNVNNRLYTQFATFVKKGRCSNEEMEEFKRLHCKYGNNWKKIGLDLNRKYVSLSGMHHQISKNWNKGQFTFKEKKVLLIAVIRLFENNEPISWKRVSDNVKTRSSKMCRHHWVRHFSQVRNWEAYNKWLLNSENKEDTIEVIAFSHNDILKLVTFISDANIDDEFLIDWNDFVKHFDHVTSPAWLKWKFQAVCKEVPQSHKLEFSDLLDQLIEIYDKKVQEGKLKEVQVID